MLPSLSAEALARARRALHIARESDLPDLEEKAQLGEAEFLSMIGRRRESLEIEILFAARPERMEIEWGTDGRVVSVEGVFMDEVVVRLGEKSASAILLRTRLSWPQRPRGWR